MKRKPEKDLALLFRALAFAAHKHRDQRRKDAEAVAKKLDGKSFMLIRQAGDRGQLYGSVSPRDVADVVEKGGFTIGRTQVHISTAIKAIGLFTIPVVLHPEVKVNITVNVARSEDEAERQARGENVIDTQFEEDRLATEEAQADLLEGGAGSIEGNYVQD